MNRSGRRPVLTARPHQYPEADRPAGMGSVVSVGWSSRWSAVGRASRWRGQVKLFEPRRQLLAGREGPPPPRMTGPAFPSTLSCDGRDRGVASAVGGAFILVG